MPPKSEPVKNHEPKPEFLTAFCPTCGTENPVRHSPEWLLLHFPEQFCKILTVLMEYRRKRQPLSVKQATEEVWKNTGKPMPKSAETLLTSSIWAQRDKLLSLGWDILTPTQSGIGLVLVPLER